jgi:hypothetical protein
MKNKIIIAALVIIAIGEGIIYTNIKATAQESKAKNNVKMPDLTGWPEASQKAAKEMSAKYGQPDTSTPEVLIWENKGAWLKTIVYKKEMRHDFPKPHSDVVEQWVNYKVNLTKYNDLAKYDGSITVNRTNGTISSRCDKEAMNILALNLAYDILKGDKTIEGARIDYAKNAMSFSKGAKTMITEKLNFSNDRLAPDPDAQMEVLSQE